MLNTQLIFEDEEGGLHIVEGRLHNQAELVTIFEEEYCKLQNKYRDNDRGYEDFYDVLRENLQKRGVDFYRNPDYMEHRLLHFNDYKNVTN